MSTTTESQASDAMLLKIRALLDKAESTTFPEEARSLTAKAQELMTKFAIDDAMLNSAKKPGERQVPESREFSIPKGPYQGPQIDFLFGLATTLGARAVLASRISAKVMILVGFPTDLEMIERLYTSLRVQMAIETTHADVVARMNAECSMPAHKVAWKNAFAVSFNREVLHRLSEQQRNARIERQNAEVANAASGSYALVLTDRNSEVKAAFDEMFPRLGTAKGSSAGRGGRTGSAQSFGLIAGSRADIGNQRLGSRKAIGGSK